MKTNKARKRVDEQEVHKDQMTAEGTVDLDRSRKMSFPASESFGGME
jgi:hypothetical protein